ncbi:MAG: AsmA family protein, partial [Bacteroidota bacterium]
MPKASLTVILRKILKILAWIFVSFLILFVIISITLQFSSVQTWLTEKILSQLSEEVQSHVSIDRVAIRFPKSVGLEGIFVEDTSGDTLLYAGSIFVDVGMMGLFRSEINVNNLELTDVVANMIREEPDTVFNYQFIIDAFAPSDTSATSDQEETPPEDEDEKADEWTFSLGNLSLENIRFRNIDHFTGTDMQLSLDQLDADLEPADLMNEKFHTGEISIDQPQIVIQMSPPSVPPEPDTTEMPEIDLAIKALIIEDPDFRFSSFDGTQMQINSDLLALYPEEISLHEYLIAIEEIEAEQLAADFNIPVTPEQEETTPPTTKTAEKEPTSFSFDFSEIMEWDIILDKLDITGSSFSMKQGDEPVKRGEFDPGNISLENINLHLSEAKVNPDQLDLTIENTSMDFSNQFSIADLNMDVNLGASSEVTLHNLTTSQSQLSFSLNTSGSLLDFSQQDLTGYRYDVSISETHIQQDLAFFVPVMNEYYFQWPDNEGIRLGARVEGTLDHLTIDSLWLAGPDFFATQLSGEITGLPNMDSLYVDLPALTLFAAPDRILANLPDTLGPQGIQLPDTI